MSKIIKTHKLIQRCQIVAKGKDVVSSQRITTATSNKMSKYHGEITRNSSGDVDIAAEMAKQPNALWIRVKAIEADVENDNGDFFSKEELLKSYKSFEGVPVFTNHENNKIEAAKGKVILAEWNEEDASVYCTMFIDREAYPSLCRAIEQGYATDVSMGTQVDYSVCSVCENKAKIASDYCFIAGTPILMSNLTSKNIEDIVIGDEVIDAFGKTTKVTKLFKRNVSEKIQCITSKAIMNALFCTSNHPIMVYRRNEYKFVKAEDITDKESLFTPKYQFASNSSKFMEVLGFEQTEENILSLARLIGYYASEGCISKNKSTEPYSTEFSIHKNETHLLNDITDISQRLFGKTPSVFTNPNSKGISVRIYEPRLAEFMGMHVPGKATTKQFSPEIINAPKSVIGQIISGYIEGDGHVRSKEINGGIVIHTASKALANQVYHMLLRLGCFGSINSFEQCGGPTSRDKKFLIYRVSFGTGQAANLNASITNHISKKIARSASFSNTNSAKNMFSDDGLFGMSNAYSVEEVPYEGPVYNFETESHTYVASNIAVHNCDHVKTMKGRTIGGKKVFEKNYGLKFIELSVVTDGACKDCTIREILDPEEVAASQAMAPQMAMAASNNPVKVIKAKQSESMLQLLGAIKVALIEKSGGQDELRKLNEAMSKMEEVCRSMLDQRQYLDLEYLSKVADVLADLQHVTDELVDQGYGSVGPNGQQVAPTPGMETQIPPLPSGAGVGGPVPSPVATGPTGVGAGSVTEPATASTLKIHRLIFSNKLQDLTNIVQKIYEEAKVPRGDTQVNPQDTIKKLANFWTNPSIRDFKAELTEGSLKIVMGGEEVYGLQDGKKVASVKIAELDPDIKELIKSNPHEAAGHMLQALKIKIAEKAPTDAVKQSEQTMEAQLRDNSPKMHPRTNEQAESITEKQLQSKKDGYDKHTRSEKPVEMITEKQLSGNYDDGLGHERQSKNNAHEETIELQLRDTGIKGNETPAASDRPWSAGVTEHNQAITEKQLEEWKKSEKSHNPEHESTEKQLREQGEPWGRRLSSKEDAIKALSETYKALAKTASATGATPEEIVSSIQVMTSKPEFILAAKKLSEKLASKKAERGDILRRASFHGHKLNASATEIEDYMLGSMMDAGMSSDVSLQVLAKVATYGNAAEKIAEAAKSLAESPKQAAAPVDFLKEAMEEIASEEDVNIIFNLNDIKEKVENKEAFAKVAFEMAAKTAADNSIKAVKNIQVQVDGEKVRVSVAGKKMTEEEVKAHKEAKAKDVTARKEARTQKVAQMPGGGGAPSAPAGNPMGGGGTTMPTPMPGDPSMGPAVSGIGGGAEEDPLGGDAGEKGEVAPPGSHCPACGGKDVDVKGGDFNCNNCGASGEIEVNLRVNNWPDTIEEKGPEKADEGSAIEEEGGMGDMLGGPGMEMPQVGVAASFKLTPEMVKIAGNKPIGSFCPHCGCGNCKIAFKQGVGRGECRECGEKYKVDIYTNEDKKELLARVEWQDMRVQKLASKPVEDKKAKLEKALKDNDLTARFAKEDVKGKIAIMAHLKNKGAL